MAGSAAAQLGRYGGGVEALSLQEREVVGHEGVGFVSVRGAGRELRAEVLRAAHPVDGGGGRGFHVYSHRGILNLQVEAGSSSRLPSYLQFEE